MQVTCDSCSKDFLAPSGPCPDGRVDCMVNHYEPSAWICPHCGHNNGKAVAKSVMDGPYEEEIPMAIINPRALRNLELYKGEGGKKIDPTIYTDGKHNE